MMASSFVFYESFHTALSHLDGETYKQVMGAICDYAFSGVEPECDGVVAMAFALIKPQLDANARRRENGKKGGRPKAEPKGTEEKPNHNLDVTKNNLDVTKVEPNVNVNANVNVNDNVKRGKKSEPRFVPPTVSEVEAYCRESGYRVDAQRFVDFYASKGWMVGKNKMKDWKASVRGWATRDKDKVVSGGTKFSNYSSERRTDYDDIERRMIAQSMGVQNG